MSLVNQAGKAVQEEFVFFSDLTLEERKYAVDQLFRQLGFDIIRTTAIDSGNTEIELRVQPIN